jgi:competence protein ComFB
MEIHNITEDIVFAKVQEVFDAIEKEGGKGDFCTCRHCRLDTACYVLNRSQPRYIMSNRGVARAEQETIERQQLEADIVALVYDGIKRVSHHQRPNFRHSPQGAEGAPNTGNTPFFNIPTIVGRIFNGINFSPLSDIQAELRQDGELTVMKDGNWQNPYTIVDKTEGTFTFWPQPVPADAAGARKIFEFSFRVAAPGFEPLNHHFQIPVTGEMGTASSYSMDRTFKLPDLYLFPPGGEEEEFPEN